MSRETDIKTSEALKVLTICPGVEPLPQNHFRFRRVKKTVSEQNTQLSTFLINPKSFVKTIKVLYEALLVL